MSDVVFSLYISSVLFLLVLKLMLSNLLQYTPKKGGRGTPRKNEIVFISPTGLEIKNNRQLDQFLRSNPGGPSSSEFDWGTGDTPRRSARISEKSKATESPENEPPKKRERKSSSKNGGKEKKDNEDGKSEGAEEEEANATDGNETKASTDAVMKETEANITDGCETKKIMDVGMKEAEVNATDGDETKASMDVEMKDAGDTGDKTVKELDLGQVVDKGAMKPETDEKIEGEVVEEPAEKTEIQDTKDSDAEKGQTEKNQLPPAAEDNEVFTEPTHVPPESTEGEKNVKADEEAKAAEEEMAPGKENEMEGSIPNQQKESSQEVEEEFKDADQQKESNKEEEDEFKDAESSL
ncbi:hypothetical protein GIB67_034381 [Kingdonia uniflora]|uniref:MBD domain-containing protein n=1 Tax=Kingdonia uniflora TaxID=39325 RepID=A0A7J7NS55_9MAGN|nr:hypothetical protein GIB67_034381 [Kingdonia uniflora]